ncbi:MAG: fimbria/pilus outer membrane usher protein [Polaromonas sp.]|uniref:fimbria/pilus outer membrane usher protein n=1 Tax=Polaromonas sp. TaxID=1869339 RepID=UPI00248862FE|nr:fimbria/pilus outer membrane usher protein [Polaromonas sp.]MDI1238539.1 fimbria/pilus outer membrane usher protein [Polaromonas sp.]
MTLALALLPLSARGADQDLLLDLLVNGYPTNRIGEFVLRGGALLSLRAELTELGFRIPDSVVAGPDGLIDLSELPSLSWQLDQPSQTLRVTADNERLLPALLEIGGRPAGKVAFESGSGATLNYDFSASSASGRRSASSLLDLRVFSPLGVFSSGLLTHTEAGQRASDAPSAIRLDSTYTFSDPGTLRRYRLGDFISGGTAWTRPIRLGGAQITSDFSLRPDLVTFPLPSVRGSAAVPSTLDVLVNGNRLLSRPVGAGPFEIAQLPVVTGAGSVSLTLTNALGQQVLTTLPFYASSALLAPGLQTFSAQAGAVRRNWGLISNDYGGMAASGSYRRGLTPAITLEASAEGTAGTVMAGAGAVLNLASLAILNVAAAGSSGSLGRGAMLSAGLQRVGTVFSFGTAVTAASQNFRDIAAVNGDPFPRLQLTASAGLSLGRFGSVGVAYAEVRRDAAVTSTGLAGGVVDLQPMQNARIVSASYSVQISRLSLYATAFRDLTRAGGSGIQFGVALPLGARSSLGASAGSGPGGRYGQVQAQQSALTTGDWGYQAHSTVGPAAQQFARVEYKAPWARLNAGVDRFGAETSLSLQVAGSLSMLDGALFPANTITDSFAVVDTNGLAGVRVLHENRDAGRTNAVGRLLVPDLRAFDVNRLAIDATDVPPDATLHDATQEVRPQDRSGVIVRFPIKLSHGALLRLVDAGGAPVPVGSAARLQASGVAFPVGYGGEVYLEGLRARNVVVVERPKARRCSVVFDYKAVPGDIPTIGPLTCREQAP